MQECREQAFFGRKCHKIKEKKICKLNEEFHESCFLLCFRLWELKQDKKGEENSGYTNVKGDKNVDNWMDGGSCGHT